MGLTFLLTVIIILISILLLSLRILLVKGGKFPNTHVSGNPALRKKGIQCAQSQHREASKQKDLYARLDNQL